MRCAGSAPWPTPYPALRVSRTRAHRQRQRHAGTARQAADRLLAREERRLELRAPRRHPRPRRARAQESERHITHVGGDASQAARGGRETHESRARAQLDDPMVREQAAPFHERRQGLDLQLMSCAVRRLKGPAVLRRRSGECSCCGRVRGHLDGDRGQLESIDGVDDGRWHAAALARRAAPRSRALVLFCRFCGGLALLSRGEDGCSVCRTVVIHP